MADIMQLNAARPVYKSSSMQTDCQNIICVVASDTLESEDESISDGEHLYATRAGYPKYSKLLGSHAEYQTFRRFRALRMRMLLLKQDRISRLERRLERLDAFQEENLFLSSFRRDTNKDRQNTMCKLDAAFKDYDAFLQQSHWALNATGPGERDLSWQKRKLDEPGFIDSSETKYIRMSARELLNIGMVKDRSMAKLAQAVEVVVEGFKHLIRRPRTTDGPVNITNSIVRGIARFVAAALAIILLLVPVIILNAIASTVVRFVVIFIAATFFVGLITVASEATLGEIFGAGAAYTAVLVVFVSGNGVSGAPTLVANQSAA